VDRFWIKRGDTRPVLRSLLLDGDGNVVSLVNATSARLIARGENGQLKTLTGTTTIEPPASGGHVVYTWGAGDTATPGEFFAEFEVTWSDAGVQTFPTAGYIELTIAGDLDSALPFTIDDVVELRRFSGEYGRTSFSDAEMQSFLLGRTGDSYAAAFDIWTMKAADAAHYVNVSEAGASRSLGDLQDHFLKMAKFYESRSPTLITATSATRGSRTRPIERP